MNKFITVFSLGLFISLVLSARPAYAADCNVVYGGGRIECVQNKITSPTATPTPTTPPPPANQSKGGLPIQPAPVTKTTPATGPEALGLISLIPMAAAGFYLRKKTQ